MVHTLYIYPDRVEMLLHDTDSNTKPVAYKVRLSNAHMDSLSLYDCSNTKVKVLGDNPVFADYLVRNYLTQIS